MKNTIIGLLLLFVLVFMTSCDKDPKPQPNIWNHDAFDALLTQYVNTGGDVNYTGFKNEQAKLKEYIDLLGANAPDSTWSNNKAMAYWINLYNAFTIYNIILEYPVNSILDIDNGTIWTTRKVTVGDKQYTLDEIEKQQLLATYNEPKVHFAVNCAAASCPPLLNKAWTESNIQQYYVDATRAFINDPTYNSISTDSIAVSQIFNWYASDFGGNNQIVIYFQQYSTTTISTTATVRYQTYDWALNEQ